MYIIQFRTTNTRKMTTNWLKNHILIVEFISSLIQEIFAIQTFMWENEN